MDRPVIGSATLEGSGELIKRAYLLLVRLVVGIVLEVPGQEDLRAPLGNHLFDINGVAGVELRTIAPVPSAHLRHHPTEPGHGPWKQRIEGWLARLEAFTHARQQLTGIKVKTAPGF